MGILDRKRKNTGESVNKAGNRPSEIETAEFQSGHYMVGLPSDYPKELEKGLIELFSRSDIVDRAYLALVWAPDYGKTPHITIGLIRNRNSNASFDGIMESMALVFKETWNDEKGPIDIIDVSEKGNMLSEFMNDHPPFYERK